MVWYVALVAVLNLGLGYALAVFLSAERPEPSPAVLDDEEAYGETFEEEAYEEPLEEPEE